jgi:sugar phosphate isomerase/epimerase
MYLSMNSVPIGGKLSWREFAGLASTTGFKGVDVMLDAAKADGVKATERLLSELNLKPAFVSLPVEFRKDDETFRKTMPALEEAAPFSAAIGCPRMMTYIMPSSDTPKDELRRVYKARFTQIADVLARSHCRLGLEFLGPKMFRTRGKYEFIWQMTEMLAFAKECGSNVGLTLDAWHWYHAGATPMDIIAAGRERIVVVHFDDSARLPPDEVRDNERLLPGEGVIDLTSFLHALQQIGYEDGLSIEVFGRGLKQMPPEQSAKMCLEAGRKTLRAAGIVES